MTAYLLENNIVDHGQLLILVGVIWLKCELGLGVNLQLKHKNIRGFNIWQKEVKLSLLSFWVMKRVSFLFLMPFHHMLGDSVLTVFSQVRKLWILKCVPFCKVVWDG